MKKHKKKKIILTTILTIFIVFIGYCVFTLNRSGIHFIGNFGRFDIDDKYTMSVYKAGEEIETRTVNVKIDGRVNGFTKRFKGIIEVEGVGYQGEPVERDNGMIPTFTEYWITYFNEPSIKKNEEGVVMPYVGRYVYNIIGKKYKQEFFLEVTDMEEDIKYSIGGGEFSFTHNNIKE